MKSHKKLYKKFCSFENLFLAYKKARKGKTKRRYVIDFEKNLHKNLMRLQQELMNKTYKPKPLKKFIIRDPKTRKISKSDFRDRIVHHAIVIVLEPIYEKIFIYDNYASRRNKGQHKALQRFAYFLRKASKNGKKLKGIKDNNYICGYTLRGDIKHYFDTIDHDILINLIKKKVKDDNLIWLIKHILNNNLSEVDGKGMPLGNYTSQFFANVYLNDFDYFVKHKLRAEYYIRYVDDFVILHNSRWQLEIWKQNIDKFLREELRLGLHPEKSKVIPLHKGVFLLGFRVFYYYKLLKKSNIRQVKMNLKEWEKLYYKELIDYKDLITKLEGWFAHAMHADTYNLRKKIVENFNELFVLG